MSYSIISTCTGCTACVRVCPVDAISGERGALHVIDSSVCIACGACGRICPSKAVLDETGALCEHIKRSEWVKPVILVERCISCGNCLEACPTSVLDWRFLTGQEVSLYPELNDAGNCIGCSFCRAACPTDAIEMKVLVKV